MSIELLTDRKYKDVSFGFGRHPSSSELLTKKNAEAVKQSVRNLLLLKSGDKPFHPEISSPVYAFLFENIAGPEIFVLKGELENYLAQYEPRFQLTDLTAKMPTPNTIEIFLSGRIVSTTEPLTINVLLDRYR